jgi:hypothetical protein
MTAKRNDCAHNLHCVGVAAEPGDEGTVDLETINGQLPKPPFVDGNDQAAGSLCTMAFYTRNRL